MMNRITHWKKRERNNLQKKKDPVKSPSGTPCLNCGTFLSALWRNCKLGNITHYLCNACGLRFKKGKFCPVCFKVYYDADTNQENWIQCSTCFNWTHRQCLSNVDQNYSCNICLVNEQEEMR